MINSQKGFGVIAIIVTIALAAAVGGGVYYSKQKAKTSVSMETNTDVSVTGESNQKIETKSSESGSLRALANLGGNFMCTFTSPESSGTVFIADSSMRGDFNSKGSVESHMIKSGDMVYVWSGSQGMKMNFSEMDANSSSQSEGSVGLDEKIDYSCDAWIKDNSKFTIPSTVTFLDLNAMIGGQGSMQMILPN